MGIISPFGLKGVGGGFGGGSALIFVPLTPTDLTAEKALLITHRRADDLQAEVGSASLNSAVVAENWNANQMTILIWVKLNFVPGDGLTHFFFDNLGTGAAQNRIFLGMDSSGILIFDVADTDSTIHRVQFDATGWAAGWHQIAVRIDFKNDEIELYTDGTSRDATPDNALSSDSITAIEATTQLGSNTSQVFNLNGAMTILVEKRSWSDAEIGADYDSGAGTPFVVSPYTIYLADYSNESTQGIYHPSGKTVSASSNSGTETTLTTAAGSDTAFPEDNEDIAYYDALGFAVYGKTDGAFSDVSGDIDNGSGALITDAELVGVHANLNGTSHFFSASDAAFPAAGITGDMTMQAWVKLNTISGLKSIITKSAQPKRMFRFYILNDELRIETSDDGTATKTRGSTQANLVAGIWIHVAVTFDLSAGSAIFYKNGAAVADNGLALDTTIFDTDPDFEIGTIQTSQFFSGGILNVSLFNDIRTAAEILTSATTPLEDLSLAGNIIGQWYFTDAAAATVIDNNEGTAGGDLVLNGGDTTDYSTHTRLTEAFLSRSLVVDGNQENGGIGAYQAGDAATTLTKDTATVFADSQSLKVLNGDGTQAFARQTITTVTGADYLFHGRFFAPTTINGASQLVDVDLTAALGITVTQAGIVAGWNEVTFAFEAGDTSTTIDLGSGSVTNAEFGFWDEVQILTQLVDNGGMEGTYTAGLAPGMVLVGGPTVTEENSLIHSGGAAQKVVGDGGSGSGISQNITIVSGEYYTVSMFVRTASGKNGTFNLSTAGGGGSVNESLSITSLTYTKRSITFKADGTLATLKFFGTTIYLDDITVTRLDTRAAASV